MTMLARDDTIAAKRSLRERGWYVRYTEWPSGHQVVLHRRSDTSVHLVTRWWPTEREAFQEALSMAAQHELRGAQPASSPTGEAAPPTARSGDGRVRDLDVVVLGNAQEDLVVQTPRLPSAREVLEGDLLAEEPGGKGVRQAIAAARLGARVALIARIGADPRGDDVLARLRAEGVRIEHVGRDPDARTGVGLVHVDRRWRTSTASASGGGTARPSLEDVRAAEDAIRRSAVVVSSLAVAPECVAEAFRIARRNGAHVVLDADPVRKVRRLMRLVDVVIVPASNCRVLTGVRVAGRRSALNAARLLLRLGAAAVVLRTAEAALLLTRNDEIWVPNPHGQYTDSGEAGDAFCSALAVSLAETPDLARAGQLASAAAALVTPRHGESQLPSRSAVDRLVGESMRVEELTLDGILPADASGDARHPPQ